MKDIKYYGVDGNGLFASILGTGHPLVMLHGGGPDRQSIIPFAKLLQDDYQVIFPDIRGYGQSICIDPSKHTWQQYAKDVISLIDYLEIKEVAISGMGLGASIAERVAYSYPNRIKALVLISPETFDKEGEGSSTEEIDLMERCAVIARSEGLMAAWKLFIPHLIPVIASMVNDAIPRTHVESFSAAMAIVYSRRLESLQCLSDIIAPTLIIPGNDVRHNSDIGDQYLTRVPHCYLGNPIEWSTIESVDQFASSIVPQILNFLNIQSRNKA